MQKRFEIGQIVNTFGIKGEAKVQFRFPLTGSDIPYLREQNGRRMLSPEKALPTATISAVF